jgi:hypothetical protein
VCVCVCGVCVCVCVCVYVGGGCHVSQVFDKRGSSNLWDFGTQARRRRPHATVMDSGTAQREHHVVRHVRRDSRHATRRLYPVIMRPLHSCESAAGLRATRAHVEDDGEKDDAVSMRIVVVVVVAVCVCVCVCARARVCVCVCVCVRVCVCRSSRACISGQTGSHTDTVDAHTPAQRHESPRAADASLPLAGAQPSSQT